MSVENLRYWQLPDHGPLPNARSSARCDIFAGFQPFHHYCHLFAVRRSGFSGSIPSGFLNDLSVEIQSLERVNGINTAKVLLILQIFGEQFGTV
jgi:hypothetical protein